MRASAIGLLGALALATLGACAGSNAAASHVPDEQVPESERYGGTMVIGIEADIDDISPLTWNLRASSSLQQFVLFLPLISYDADLQPVPRLARSWELSPDTTQLIFRLRDDIYWHDGVKTTAHDLQFSYERARDQRTGYIYSSMFERYGEAEVVDSFTWRVRVEPHAQYLDVWRVFPSVPRHLLADVAPQELARHPFGTRSPVGNGPFRFVDRLPGQLWVFEANEAFPAELGGRPYLDRLVFRVTPEPTTRLTELLTGGIDFYTHVPWQQATRIETAAGVRLLTYPGKAWTHIAWNHRRWPFEDARVRRALTLGIDRQAIADGVGLGRARVANSTIAPFLPQHDPAAGADLGHDPERARALLAEAGFQPGVDGVLLDSSGRALRLTLKVAHGSQNARDAAVMTQAHLRRLGVDVRLELLEFGTLRSQLAPDRRDFDAVIITWEPEFRIDDAQLFACHSAASRYNLTGYCDPATDALLDSIARTLDPVVARGLWSQYQHRLAAAQPVTLLFFADELQAVRDRVRGVQPDARGPWVGIEGWWLHPARR